MKLKTRTSSLAAIAASFSLIAVALPLAAIAPMPAFAEPGSQLPNTYGENTYGETVPVGRLPGSAGVGSQGNGTYSIPLETPVNRGNLIPPLSLEYSSTGALGPYGEGWSIAGVPTISYCHQGRGHWGWCLDGTPLVNTGEEWDCSLDGGCPSGAGTTQAARFRTHPDKSIRVTMLRRTFDGWDGSGASVTNWVVETPDGKRTDFWGCRGAETCTATHISDAHGNYVELKGFDTFRGAEVYLPSPARIVFSGNSRQDIAAPRSMEFRGDAIVLPGKYYKLSTVDYAGCEAYSPTSGECTPDVNAEGGGVTQLRSATLCEGHPDDETAGACLPPTRFDYGMSHEGLYEAAVHPWLGVDMPSDPCHGPLFADFDGNGITDVLWGEEACETNAVSIQLMKDDGPGETLKDIAEVPPEHRITVTDLDGDGSQDLVFHGSLQPFEAGDIPTELRGLTRIGTSAGPPALSAPSATALGLVVGWSAADLDDNGVQDLVTCEGGSAQPESGHIHVRRGVRINTGLEWIEEDLHDSDTGEVVTPTCYPSAYRTRLGVTGAEVKIGWTSTRVTLVEIGSGSHVWEHVDMPEGGLVRADETGQFVYEETGCQGSPDVTGPSSADVTTRRSSENRRIAFLRNGRSVRQM